MSSEQKRWLPIPVGVNSPEGMFVGWIPFPMSEEDYDLMIATLELWKLKLTRADELLEPNPTSLIMESLAALEAYIALSAELDRDELRRRIKDIFNKHAPAQPTEPSGGPKT